MFNNLRWQYITFAIHAFTIYRSSYGLCSRNPHRWNWSQDAFLLFWLIVIIKLTGPMTDITVERFNNATAGTDDQQTHAQLRWITVRTREWRKNEIRPLARPSLVDISHTYTLSAKIYRLIRWERIVMWGQTTIASKPVWLAFFLVRICSRPRHSHVSPQASLLIYD